MSRNICCLWIVGMPWALAAAPLQPPQDLLRFVNGDQLHGSFQGIKEGPVAVWQRADLTAPGEFKSTLIQKIILRAGRPVKSNAELAHVALVNGDRIPGTLAALDAEAVTVATTFAGQMRIPRKLVGMLAPLPLGGRVLYHGPYSEDGWLMTNHKFPAGIPAPSPADAGAGQAQDAAMPEVPAPDEAPPAEVKAGGNEEKARAGTDAPIPRWDFSGAAWYWNHKQGSTALVRKSGMTDRSILRFNLAWRNRLMLNIALHADFAPPPRAETDNDAAPAAGENAKKRELLDRLGNRDIALLPKLFGNSYVLQINAGYALLIRCGYAADGKPFMERIQLNNPSIRLPETGSAAFELRCDRRSGSIVLHIDGEFAMQWSEPGLAAQGGYAGKGEGIGFLVQMEDSPVRISDVLIAEWNGMPDSARSMQVEDQDIVLLANGADRFSGKVVDFQNGKLRLHSQFGDFSFPLDAIAEVRFARNSLAKHEESKGPQLVVRLDPLGNITGQPLSGDAHALNLLTSYAGVIKLQLESAIILDFQPSNNFLDDWDPQF
jgi:hypothetical protein